MPQNSPRCVPWYVLNVVTRSRSEICQWISAVEVPCSVAIRTEIAWWLLIFPELARLADSLTRWTTGRKRKTIEVRCLSELSQIAWGFRHLRFSRLP